MGGARLIARTGAMLFCGAGLVAFVNSFAFRAMGVVGVDAGRMRMLALLSLISAVAVLFVPWHRLPHRASISLAVLGLVLLLASGQWTGYAASEQARVAYPALRDQAWVTASHSCGGDSVPGDAAVQQES